MAELIGIIGGSGLYELPGLERVRRKRLRTPFGAPSDEYVLGRLAGRDVAFLARHGAGHVVRPSELNARANVWGFKALGATRLISVSAVGSMKEAIAPGHAVVPDQLVDRTTRPQEKTFFGRGVVAHVAFAEPYCGALGAHLAGAAEAAWGQGNVHRGGTYLCIDGPQFSTRAESMVYRSWGVSVIGMTNAPEAKLAREAELCFATLALATDYDCWYESHESVTVDQVVAVMSANVERAKAALARAVETLPEARTCRCGSALDGAVMTRPDAIPPAARKRVALLLGDRLAPPARKAPSRSNRKRKAK